MKYELGLEEPDKKRARKSAFNIGAALTLLVAQFPYFLMFLQITL